MDTGGEAKAYADHFIGLHLSEIAGGKTYSQISAAAQQDPKNTELAEQTATLFRGETLRGLLLGAWGWGTVGTVALIAGWVLVVLGAILFLLPALDWFVNGRTKHSADAPAAPAPVASA